MEKIIRLLLILLGRTSFRAEVVLFTLFEHGPGDNVASIGIKQFPDPVQLFLTEPPSLQIDSFEVVPVAGTKTLPQLTCFLVRVLGGYPTE